MRISDWSSDGCSSDLEGVPIHLVGAVADRRLERDLLADLEEVEVVERATVGRAVTRDRDVADLTGQGSVGVVAGAGPQGAGGRALDDHDVDFDRRAVEPGEAVTDVDVAVWVVQIGTAHV